MVIDEAARKLALKRAEKLLAMVESTVEVNEKIAEQVAERWTRRTRRQSQAVRGAPQRRGQQLRALGMGEDGTASGEEKSKDKEGRKPLIVVFNGGGVPPVVRGDG